MSCWFYAGYIAKNGYGMLHNIESRKTLYAHRFVYENLVGHIPDGLELDHLCRNRSCINPDHLEPVTRAENVRRGLAGEITAARQRAKTSCPQGHPYDAENTYIWRNRRDCRICRREARRKYERHKVLING